MSNVRKSNTYEMQNNFISNDHNSSKRQKWFDDVRSDAGRGSGMNLPAWMTKPNIDRKIVDAQNSVVLKGRSDALPINHRSQQHATLPVCHNSSSFATPHATTPHDSTTHDSTPHDSSFAHYGTPRPVNTQHARL